MYYIVFEVLESAWTELLDTLSQASGDVDLLVSAHHRYLNRVSSKAMLLGSTANTTHPATECVIKVKNKVTG